MLARGARLRGGAARRRHRPGRRGRPPAARRPAAGAARERGRSPDVAGRAARRLPRPHASRIEPFRRAAARRARADASRARARPARLRGKNGFSDVVVGVSGGIDSALTAALAVEALGAERVHCVSMPSRYSSERRARRAAARREPRHRLPRAADRRDRRRLRRRSLAESFAGRSSRPRRGEPAGADPRRAADGALEQVRLAGGRDREQVGALGRLRDALRRHGRRLRAAEGRLQDRRLPARAAPERAGRQGADPAPIIERAPSAELRDDQLDEDSLPPYPALDRVLEAYVEQDRSREELSQDGFDRRRGRAGAGADRPRRVQAPPGPARRAPAPKAFGRDRRTPITNRWRG